MGHSGNRCCAMVRRSGSRKDKHLELELHVNRASVFGGLLHTVATVVTELAVGILSVRDLCRFHGR